MTSGDETSTTTVDESSFTVEALLRKLNVVVTERDHYKQLAAVLKRELDRIRDLQKTPREHVDLDQVQLAFEQVAKELLEKIKGTPASPPGGPPPGDAPGGAPPGDAPKPKGRRSSHGRSELPEHLPVRTVVLTPVGVPVGAVVIDYEVSWRLGFQRGGFHRLKLLRPVFSVPKATPVDASVVSATLFEGNVANAPVAPAASTSAEVGIAESAECPLAQPEAPTEPEETPSCVEPAVDEVATDGVIGNAPDGNEVSDATSTAKTKLVCAELPSELIPRSLPTADLLAHVFTQKFADKNPFHRQQGIYAREGVAIPRTNMCRWAEEAHLRAKRIVEAMIKEALETAPYICTDATGVLVQANERCKRGHFWVFVAGREHVFFRYSKKHSSDEPLAFFKGYKGTVVADASNVYDALFRLPDGPDEGGCNAHARRYFYKALGSDKPRALVGVGFFNALFELERGWTKLPPQKRLELRKLYAAPLMESLRIWREDELLKSEVADGSPIRRALMYTRNQWEALTRFLQDGKIPAHNNWSEGQLRRLVVGRANWTFVGSDDSAEWTCTFVSLVASCELHKLDPEAYFADIFRVLPVWPQTRLLELAPRYWAQTRARLDPFELAVPLGPITVPGPLPAAP